MSINLLETIQQNLGYPALQKINPNTQQVAIDEKHLKNTNLARRRYLQYLPDCINMCKLMMGQKIIYGLILPQIG